MAQSKFLTKRFDCDIPLAKEMIINTFFKSIRENIKVGALTNDEEILLVLQCMNEVFDADEDANASILSEYLGITV